MDNFDSSPLITVVIPFRDRVDLLQQTIKSLQNQSIDSWKAILIDDASQIESVNTIFSAVKADRRFSVVGREGAIGGPSRCRNQGASIAVTPLLMFLDSDDLLTQNALTRRIEVMCRNEDVDFCIFSSLAFSTDEHRTKQWTVDWNGSSDLDRLLAREWPLNVSSVVWRTEYFNRLGRFDEDIPSWEDWDLHVRVLSENPKYLRFAEANVLIRTVETHNRISSVQYRNSEHLEAASRLFPRLAAFLLARGLLTRARSSALCELMFGNAYLSLMQDGARVALVRYKYGEGTLAENPVFSRNKYRLLWCILKHRLGLI